MPGRAGGHPGQRGHRPDHGPAHDPGGGQGAGLRGGDALLRRPEPEHRPVPARLRHPPATCPTPSPTSGAGTGWSRWWCPRWMRTAAPSQAPRWCSTATPCCCRVGLIPENELTRQAGMEMDRRTNGAVVYENMETSMPGVFACGNVRPRPRPGGLRHRRRASGPARPLPGMCWRAGRPLGRSQCSR